MTSAPTDAMGVWMEAMTGPDVRVSSCLSSMVVPPEAAALLMLLSEMLASCIEMIDADPNGFRRVPVTEGNVEEVVGALNAIVKMKTVPITEGMMSALKWAQLEMFTMPGENRMTFLWDTIYMGRVEDMLGKAGKVGLTLKAAVVEVARGTGTIKSTHPLVKRPLIPYAEGLAKSKRLTTVASKIMTDMTYDVLNGTCAKGKLNPYDRVLVPADVSKAIKDILPHGLRWYANNAGIGWVCAGGAIETAQFDESGRVRDYDLFLVCDRVNPDPSVILAEIVHAMRCFAKEAIMAPVVMDKRNQVIDVTVPRSSGHVRVQLMLNVYASPRQVVDLFDIGTCCFLCDGENIMMNEMAMLCLAVGGILMDPFSANARTPQRIGDKKKKGIYPIAPGADTTRAREVVYVASQNIALPLGYKSLFTCETVWWNTALRVKSSIDVVPPMMSPEAKWIMKERVNLAMKQVGDVAQNRLDRLTTYDSMFRFLQLGDPEAVNMLTSVKSALSFYETLKKLLFVVPNEMTEYNIMPRNFNIYDMVAIDMVKNPRRPSFKPKAWASTNSGYQDVSEITNIVLDYSLAFSMMYRGVPLPPPQEQMDWHFKFTRTLDAQCSMLGWMDMWRVSKEMLKKCRIKAVHKPISVDPSWHKRGAGVWPGMPHRLEVATEYLDGMSRPNGDEWTDILTADTPIPEERPRYGMIIGATGSTNVGDPAIVRHGPLIILDPAGMEMVKTLTNTAKTGAPDVNATVINAVSTLMGTFVAKTFEEKGWLEMKDLSSSIGKALEFKRPLYFISALRLAITQVLEKNGPVLPYKYGSEKFLMSLDDPNFDEQTIENEDLVDLGLVIVNNMVLIEQRNEQEEGGA
jgi:hypothetical protein